MKYAIIISLLCISCGPTFYLKKAERAIKKAEQLGAVIQHDTVYTDRTYFIPEYKTDTVIKVQSFTDTIRIENERVKWKIKINTVEKEVFVEAKCKADTVIIRTPIEVIRKINSGYSLWDMIILCIVVFVVGVVLSKFLWRK